MFSQMQGLFMMQQQQNSVNNAAFNSGARPMFGAVGNIFGIHQDPGYGFGNQQGFDENPFQGVDQMFGMAGGINQPNGFGGMMGMNNIPPQNNDPFFPQQNGMPGPISLVPNAGFGQNQFGNQPPQYGNQGNDWNIGGHNQSEMQPINNPFAALSNQQNGGMQGQGPMLDQFPMYPGGNQNSEAGLGMGNMNNFGGMMNQPFGQPMHQPFGQPEANLNPAQPGTQKSTPEASIPVQSKKHKRGLNQ